MNIVAFATRICLARLEFALAESHSLRSSASLADLQRELDEGRADVAVVDLDSCRAADVPLLIAIVTRHGPAVIAHGVFTPPVVRTMATLARHGLCHMVYRGVDDGPGNLRRAVRDADGTRLSAEILERLAPMLCPSPAALRGAIAQLFYDPLRFRSVADVARAAGITRRSLDRTLCTLALEPARAFLLAARVSWAYRHIRATNVRVSDISRQLGVSKPERFAKQTRSLLGVTPSTIRTHVAPDQFVEMIVVRLRRQPRPSPASASFEPPGHGLGPAGPGRSAERSPARDGVGTSLTSV